MITNSDTSIEESLKPSTFKEQSLEITISNSYAAHERVSTPLSDFSEELSETIIYPEKINSPSTSKSSFTEILDERKETEKLNPTETKSPKISAKTEMNNKNMNTENSMISSPDPSQAPKRKYNILNDPSFLASNTMPPNLKPPQKPDLHRDDNLVKSLSTEKFQFKPQLTSLYMIPTTYKFSIAVNRQNDHFISYASRQLFPYDYWITNQQKLFTLQFNLLRPSVFDLHTDDSNSNFHSANKKRVHHETYKRFWETNPISSANNNFIFQNRKFTSPFSFHLSYHIKPEFTKGSLRNYDPIKQYYLFTPKINPDRPILIPQECLNSSDSLNIDQETIPHKVSHPYPHLTKVFDHPLNDKAFKIYNVLASQDYSYNELIFLTAQSIAFISKKQYKYPSGTYAQAASESDSPSENIPEKYEEFQKIMTVQKQIEALLDPYKAINPQYNYLTLLKNIIHGYQTAFYTLSNLQLHLKNLTRSNDEMQNSMNLLRNTFNINPPPGIIFQNNSTN